MTLNYSTIRHRRGWPSARSQPFLLSLGSDDSEASDDSPPTPCHHARRNDSLARLLARLAFWRCDALPLLMDANSTTVLRCRFLISGPHERRLRSVSRANYTLLDPPVTAILKGILPPPAPSSLPRFFHQSSSSGSPRFSLPFSKRCSARGEFSTGQRSFSLSLSLSRCKEREKARDRERESQSINIRRGQITSRDTNGPSTGGPPSIDGGWWWWWRCWWYRRWCGGVCSRNADVGTWISLSLSFFSSFSLSFRGARSSKMSFRDTAVVLGIFLEKSTRQSSDRSRDVERVTPYFYQHFFFFFSSFERRWHSGNGRFVLKSVPRLKRDSRLGSSSSIRRERRFDGSLPSRLHGSKHWFTADNSRKLKYKLGLDTLLF